MLGRATCIRCLLCVALLTSGCTLQLLGTKPFNHVPEPDTYPVAALSPREVEVIEAWFNKHHPNDRDAGVPLVIDELTSSAETLLDTECFRANHVDLSAGRDFKRVNRTQYRLPADVSPHFRVVRLSREDAASIWRGSQGWRRFYGMFPKSSGSFTISRPGFSADGKTALLYVGWSGEILAGEWRVYVLRLSKGRWEVTDERVGPTMVS